MKAISGTSRAGKPESYCWFCDTANLHLSLVPASITHYLNTHTQAYLRLFRSTCFCETESWNRSGVYWKAPLKDLIINGRKNILNHNIFALFFWMASTFCCFSATYWKEWMWNTWPLKGQFVQNMSFQTNILLCGKNPLEKSFKYLLSCFKEEKVTGLEWNEGE